MTEADTEVQPTEVFVKTKGRRPIHGMEGTREYAAWANMKHRCKNSTHKQYHHYGGRGIKVCDRWKSFVNFYSDMGERPVGATLDRIDNDGNYEPGNVRWATRTQQQRNRRVNRILTIRGESKCVAAWAQIVGLEFHTITARLRKGLDAEAAVFQPLDKSKSFPKHK